MAVPQQAEHFAPPVAALIDVSDTEWRGHWPLHSPFGASAALIDVSDTEWRKSGGVIQHAFGAALIDVSDTEWRCEGALHFLALHCAALIDVSDTEWRISESLYLTKVGEAALIDVSDTEWRTPFTVPPPFHCGSTH